MVISGRIIEAADVFVINIYLIKTQSTNIIYIYWIPLLHINWNPCKYYKLKINYLSVFCAQRKTGHTLCSTAAKINELRNFFFF